jgi:hypothetical protein
MKKFIYSLIILTSISLLSSCKTSSHVKCDSYGFNTYSDSTDINVINWESQKKYSTITVVKL